MALVVEALKACCGSDQSLPPLWCLCWPRLSCWRTAGPCLLPGPPKTRCSPSVWWCFVRSPWTWCTASGGSRRCLSWFRRHCQGRLSWWSIRWHCLETRRLHQQPRKRSSDSEQVETSSRSMDICELSRFVVSAEFIQHIKNSLVTTRAIFTAIFHTSVGRLSHLLRVRCSLTF